MGRPLVRLMLTDDDGKNVDGKDPIPFHVIEIFRLINLKNVNNCISRRCRRRRCDLSWER